MLKQFKYHPVIADLKVAEDGSEIIYKNEALPIHWSNEQPRVSIEGKKVGVAKLVLEAFDELRPSLNHRCVMIVPEVGLHHTNLVWEERQKSLKNASRKLTNEQEHKLIAKYEAGASRKELAAEYGINFNTVSQIKNRVLRRRNGED